VIPFVLLLLSFNFIKFFVFVFKKERGPITATFSTGTTTTPPQIPQRYSVTRISLLLRLERKRKKKKNYPRKNIYIFIYTYTTINVMTHRVRDYKEREEKKRRRQKRC
jgi:hypothetical protein